MRLPLHKSLAVSLALCAMVLRALLPDGWMPSANASAAPFIICSADGAHRDGKKSPPVQERSHAPCAFSAAAPLAPPQPVELVVTAPSRILGVAKSHDDDRFTASSHHRPNAARAPPAFS